MATLKFYIKDNKADKTNIYFFLNYGAYKMVGERKKYIPLKYYINESIAPTFWNSKAGRVKQDKRFKQHPEFNARLQNIEDTALSVLRKMQNDSELITNDSLKTKLDEVLKPYKDQTANKGKMELMQFIPYYIDTCNKSKGTKVSYNRVYTDLQDYEQANNIKLFFDRIDIDFHNRFIQHFLSKGYAQNTIGTRIKVLKTFMNVAYDMGLHANLDYKKRAFSKPKEDTVSVYLNDEELTKLYNLDLSKNKTHSNVRDWFLIAAYTGLRFSDFSRLTKDNIKDEISIKTQKTGQPVVIPLHTYVRNILERHDYNLPKVMSNQKYNKYVKEVCKTAGIDEDVLIEEKRGNLTSSKVIKKHSLVSAHTARRSFATNAFIAGVPTISIMKITGHKTEKVFMNYIKVTEKENAKKLQLHPFFNKLIIK